MSFSKQKRIKNAAPIVSMVDVILIMWLPNWPLPVTGPNKSSHSLRTGSLIRYIFRVTVPSSFKTCTALPLLCSVNSVPRINTVHTAIIPNISRDITHIFARLNITFKRNAPELKSSAKSAVPSFIRCVFPSRRL